MSDSSRITITSELSTDFAKAFKQASSLAQETTKEINGIAKAEKAITQILQAQKAVREAQASGDAKAIAKTQRQLERLESAYAKTGGSLDDLEKQLEDLGKQRQAAQETLAAVTPHRDIAKAISDIQRLREIIKSTGGSEQLTNALKAATRRAKELGVEIEETDDSLPKAAKATEQLRDKLKQAVAQIKAAPSSVKNIGDAFREARQNGLESLAKGILDLPEKAKSASSKIRASMKNAFKEVGIGALRTVGGGLVKGVAGGVGALMGGVSGSLEAASGYKKNAALVGMGAADYANLEKHLKNYGLEAGALAGLMQESAIKAGEAMADKTGDIAKTIKGLGVSTAGLSTQETFQTIIDALTKVEDQQARAEQVNKLLGGEAVALVEALRVSGKSFEELTTESKSRKGALSEKDIQKQIELQEKMNEVQDKIQSAIANVLGKLKPEQIEKVFDAIFKIAEPLLKLIDPLLKLVDALMPVVEMLSHFLSNVVTVIVEGIAELVNFFGGDVQVPTPASTAPAPSTTVNNNSQQNVQIRVDSLGTSTQTNVINNLLKLAGNAENRTSLS